MNALPADFTKEKALKFECKLGGRKTVASFIPKGNDPDLRVTVQLSRPHQPEEIRWWRPFAKARNAFGKRSELVFPLCVKVDTARALYATLGAALKAIDARNGASNVEHLPLLPIRVEAEPCKLTLRQRIRNKLIGW